MKEDGDSISEWRRRRPHDMTTSEDRLVIPDWSSLPPELVEGIADRVLATTGGVDAYMDMRAVCPSWRSAVAKPSPLAAVADLRFRPRHWIMVDLKSGNLDDGDSDYEDARLFLHVPTGRFRRLRLPALRGHLVLGASDGLIVLREREMERRLRLANPCTPSPGVRLLNPFTGDVLHFAAPLWRNATRLEGRILTAVSGGGGAQPALVVWRDWKGKWDNFLYADPTSEEFTEEDIGMSTIESMVSFQGSVYYACDGCVLKFVVAPAEQCEDDDDDDDDDGLVVIAEVSEDMDIYLEGNDESNSYLVESAGELLLVCRCDEALKVFRVDVEHRLLEEVKSLGCRALFLGGERCVSVDADMLPSVDADCVYLCDWVETEVSIGRYMHVYNLRDDTMEILFTEPMLRTNTHLRTLVHVEQSPQGYPVCKQTQASIPPEQRSPVDYGYCESRGIFTRANNHQLPPLSLSQVLLDYCE